MENAQNETQQTGATQNETPQSNATSNNGNSNPKRSWIRRHPILSIILFVILFIIIISIATSKDESEDDIINKCESGLLSDEVYRYCYLPCSGGNMTACYYGCFTKVDLDTCDYICEFQYNDDEKNIVSQYNETENNKKIDIEEACSLKERLRKIEKDAGVSRKIEKDASVNGSINDNSACHVSKWKLKGDVPNQSLSNFSWTNASISIPLDAVIDCAPATGTIENIQTSLELGEHPNPIYFRHFSKQLLPCAKALNSTELQEVAKKCNGKWF